MGKKYQKFLVAPVLKLNTDHLGPLKTAYWAITGAPGIINACMVNCISKIILVIVIFLYFSGKYSWTPRAYPPGIPRWKFMKKYGTSTMNFFSRAGHQCHSNACRSTQNCRAGTSRGARDSFHQDSNEKLSVSFIYFDWIIFSKIFWELAFLGNFRKKMRLQPVKNLVAPVPRLKTMAVEVFRIADQALSGAPGIVSMKMARMKRWNSDPTNNWNWELVLPTTAGYCNMNFPADSNLLDHPGQQQAVLLIRQDCNPQGRSYWGDRRRGWGFTINKFN